MLAATVLSYDENDETRDVGAVRPASTTSQAPISRTGVSRAIEARQVSACLLPYITTTHWQHTTTQHGQAYTYGHQPFQLAFTSTNQSGTAALARVFTDIERAS